VFDLARVTAEFLAEADGRGVLQVRATDLQDVAEGLGFGEQCRVKLVQRGDELMDDGVESRKMNSGGDDVVAGLAAVDVVVGMNGFIAALAAEEFDGAIGDDLIRVHVRGGAGAGLENIHDELVGPTCHR